MYKQSDAALAAWRATERTLDGKVTITDTSGNETNYVTSDITSIAYDSGAWTGDTFSIGSTYENNITVTFAHLVEGLKQGYKVTAKIGIKLPDGTYEYCPLGVFIISDEITMDRNNDATTIKAYDQFCAMQGTYTSKLTYPAKITDVIAEIANMSGVELNTDDIAELPTQTDLVSAISGQTYCTAIGWIAQFYGGFALFDRDGKLTIRTVTDASYILDASQYEQSGLTKNEATYQIGGMSVSVTTTTTDSTGESSETTSTLTAGETTGSQIELTNNVMTQARLDSIWSAIKDITFYPYSLTWFGNPAIEAGDWLALKDTAGNSFNVPNNSYTMTFDGGLTATSKADQTSTSSSSYSYSGTLSQTVKQLAGRQGATGNYIFGTDTTVEPTTAKIGDQWYKKNGNKLELWQYVRQSDGTGKWELIVSDLTGEEIKTSVAAAQEDATTATTTANNAVTTADNALSNAQTAISNAQTASDTANNATTVANNAISQATSASTVANAVNEEITTLKGGSTATIAELEDGLALKLSTSDFDTQIANYATQTWTTNQITATSTSLSSTISSVQTQVNNSAVGTNLITNSNFSSGLDNWVVNQGTNADCKATVTTDSAGDTCVHITGTGNDCGLWCAPVSFNQNQITTGSVMAKGTGTLAWAGLEGRPTFMFGTISTESYSKVGSTMQAGSNTNNFCIYFNPVNGVIDIYIKFAKLEKGSNASDWLANPADNATVTSVSNLTQTVTSLSTVVSGKVDNATYTSKITELANSIATKVESATYNSKMTQLDSAISAKVATTDYNAEVTLLSNQIDSKVSQTDFNSLGQVNLVPNGGFLQGIDGWKMVGNPSNMYYSDLASDTINGHHSIILYVSDQTAQTWYGAASPRFAVKDDNTISYQAWIMVWKLPDSGQAFYLQIEWFSDGVNGTNGRTGYYAPSSTTISSTGSWVNVKAEGIQPPSGTTAARLVLYASMNGAASMTQVMATPGPTIGSYVENVANYSQITQLYDNINLRVVKNDVINQINVSTESILIAGNKVHITGSTTIDDATITSAMIDSISADKITAGTLNAANVNVINLNANNISSGTITGVSFHQSSSGMETWIDNNGIHNYDDSHSTWIKNGQITTNYLTVSNISGNSSAVFSFDSTGLNIFTPYILLGEISQSFALLNSNGVNLGTSKSSLYLYDDEFSVSVNGATSSTSIYLNETSFNITPSSDDGITYNTSSGMNLTSKNGITLKANNTINVYPTSMMMVWGDFSVTGSKNAIVQTSAGWAKINAYETAEYYFGDIAKVNTGSGSKVKVEMDSLFLETVNTNVDYHVFVSSYGAGYAWISEQTSTYFVIESSTPNLEASYEIKAKRKGYENTRLEIDEDFGKEAA